MEEKTPKSFLKPKHTVPQANVSHMTEFKVRVEEHGYTKASHLGLYWETEYRVVL
jgi:hypothetical protein